MTIILMIVITFQRQTDHYGDNNDDVNDKNNNDNNY